MEADRPGASGAKQTRRKTDAPPDHVARGFAAFGSPARSPPGPPGRCLTSAELSALSALPLRDGKKVRVDIAAPADQWMHAQPARRVLIDKRLPHFLPVGLTVALRAAHRRPEIFHALSIVPVS